MANEILNDRELLEMAAKATGIKVLAVPANAAKPRWLYCWINKTRKPWNPLIDDGDALRLAVNLNLLADRRFIHERDVLMFTKNTPKLDATRRAIVRAAAAIGAAK